MAKKFDIFISYRRKGGYDMAKLLYDRLRLDGYSVSFDIDTLEKGNFDSELEKRVLVCKDFLLVMSPKVFDRFYDSQLDPKNDWVRQEIICALETNKNIVPLALDGFDFPKEPLPDDVKDVSRKNALDLNPKHFEAAYAKLKLAFLVSKPRWTVRYRKYIIALIVVVFLALAGVIMKQQRADLKTGELDEILGNLEKYVSRLETETQRLPENSLKLEEILGNLEKYVFQLEAEMKKLPENSPRRNSVSAEIKKNKKRIENLQKSEPEIIVNIDTVKPIKAAPAENKQKAPSPKVEKNANKSDSIRENNYQPSAVHQRDAKREGNYQPPAVHQRDAKREGSSQLSTTSLQLFTSEMQNGKGVLNSQLEKEVNNEPSPPEDPAALLNTDTRKRIDSEADDFLKRMRSR
ncbi:MAG: TIR domain-containing protein [Fibromonadaceae bacterium]|jgi:hypothetical protein|nr:TIR domain-containing protein [Fibromonadaceae bacterium]